MNQNDYLEFAQYLTGTAEILDGQLSEVKLQFYFNALKDDLSIEDLKLAINRILKTSRFFPKPAEIREALFGKPEDRAIIAIDKIINAVRSVSKCDTVCFDDPIIHLIIENYGGWEELHDSAKEEWKYLKKDLLKQYQAYANKDISLTAIPETLVGWMEKNTSEGDPWPEDKTYFIGDKKTALAWRERRKALEANSWGEAIYSAMMKKLKK